MAVVPSSMALASVSRWPDTAVLFPINPYITAPVWQFGPLDPTVCGLRSLSESNVCTSRHGAETNSASHIMEEKMRKVMFAFLALAVAGCGFQRTQVSSSVDDHAEHMNASDLRVPGVVPATSQGAAGIPASADAAPARIAAGPRHGEWVKIAVG